MLAYTSQQQASVSQGRICSDNFTCCHTEIEAADQTFISPSHSIETATETLKANLVEEGSSRVEPMTCTGESPREAGAPTTLLTTKTKTRIGTWNIRTLYETGKSAQVCQEMHRYNLKLLGLCETRWTGTGRTRLASGDTIIYFGQEEGQPHPHGVALLMTPEATQALLSWEPVSPRILTARFNSKGRRVTIIQCYAPTNRADIEDKVHFYEQVQSVMDRVRWKGAVAALCSTRNQEA